jgi:hypothetical protein
MFTPEQMQLLEGDERRAQRNLPRLGFGDATTAPAWAQARIVEIRQAVVENRAVPPPSREYIASCEQRSAARLNPKSYEQLYLEKHGREYRPIRQTPEQVRAATAKRTGTTVEALIDAELRLQAKTQAAEIARTAPPVLTADETLPRKNGLGLPWRASY